MELIRRNYKLPILSGFKFSYEMHKKLYKNLYIDNVIWPPMAHNGRTEQVTNKFNNQL